MQALQLSLIILTGAASRMSTGNLRRILLETLLFDSIIQDFIFQILSIGPTLEVTTLHLHVVVVDCVQPWSLFSLVLKSSTNNLNIWNILWPLYLHQHLLILYFRSCIIIEQCVPGNSNWCSMPFIPFFYLYITSFLTSLLALHLK